MKKILTLALTLAYSGLHAGDITADIYSDGGFTLSPGPFTYGGDWRDNGGTNENAVYDARATNPNFSSLYETIDITTIAAFTGDADYDVNTTKLTGFDTNTASLDFRIVADGRMNPAIADYNMFWEIDVETIGGNYRLKSNNIKADDLPSASSILNGGDEFSTWNWQGGSFLGDLTAAGGVEFANIVNIIPKVVIQAATVDGTQTQTEFWIVDNLALSATVSTVPEPGTYALLAGLAALSFVAIRRRK